MKTSEMNVAQIRAEIELRGDGSYFDHEFALWAKANYGTDESTVTKMIRVEAKDRIEEGRDKGRNKDGRAQKAACLAILGWLTEAHEYAVNTDNLRDLADFVSSHRQACVWAVLVGKSQPVTVAA